MGRIDFERIKKLVPVRAVLPRSALQGWCPFCGASGFGIEPDFGLWACPACESEGDVVDAFRLLEGLDLRTAATRLHRRAGAIEHAGNLAGVLDH